MNIERGVVTQLAEKDGQYGKMYSAKINGNWYGIGKYPPKFQQGDNIEFQWTAKGNYRNLDNKTVSKLPSAPAATPVAGASSYAPAAPDKRQETISKQWAVNAGVNWVTALIQAEALPNLKKTATASEKYDYLNGLLTEHIDQFLFMATGQGLGEAMAKQVGLSSDTPAVAEGDGEWT